MCKETTAIRLKKIMDERNLRQADILEMVKPYCEKYHVKMNRSDLSQYCTGKVEPHQEKLFVLGCALNVSEAWLMGFDVPQERKGQDAVDHFQATALEFNENRHRKIISMNLSDNELEIIGKYRTLDSYGKEAIDEILDIECRRCKDKVQFTEEELRKLPLEERLVLERFLDDDGELVARHKSNKK